MATIGPHANPVEEALPYLSTLVPIRSVGLLVYTCTISALERSRNLREVSLKEVRQLGDSHELLRLRTHINELQLALLPFS